MVSQTPVQRHRETARGAWRLHTEYRGFRVFESLTKGGYRTQNPAHRRHWIARPTLREIVAIIDEHEERTAFLAKGYSPCQWYRLVRKRQLEGELLKLKWQQEISAKDDPRAELCAYQLREVERQLEDLADAEHPPLPAFPPVGPEVFGDLADLYEPAQEHRGIRIFRHCQHGFRIDHSSLAYRPKSHPTLAAAIAAIDGYLGALEVAA